VAETESKPKSEAPPAPADKPTAETAEAAKKQGKKGTV
jgi:hypothetical protein